jgi:energy-coupling factor transporter ATP-binding protein EcfA2
MMELVETYGELLLLPLVVIGLLLSGTVYLMDYIYGTGRFKHRRRQRDEAPTPLPAPARPEPEPIRAAPAHVREPAPQMPQLSLKHWLRLLNDQPDQVPHVLIAGKSGSGKTTLARALLAHRRGEVVILHPKSTEDDWAPLEWYTVDTDGTFTTIAGILGDLYAELQQRPAGVPQLTVVLDDVSAIAQDKTSKASYQQFVKAAARLGRSKRVRLLMLAHETTAQAVGLPGEVALLENFSRVNVERHSHQATLEHADDRYLLDTRSVTREARRPFNLSLWDPPAPALDAAPDDDLVLAGLLSEEPLPALPSQHGGTTEAGNGGNTPGNDGGNTPLITPEQAQVIRKLAALGASQRDLLKLLGGNRGKMHAALKRVLDEVEEPQARVGEPV